jgi:hypothetical protein
MSLCFSSSWDKYLIFTPLEMAEMEILLIDCQLHFSCLSFRTPYNGYKNRDGPVGIAADYGLSGRCSIPGRGKKFYFIRHGPDRSRDSAVDIVTQHELGDRGGLSSSPGRVKIFLFSTSSRPAVGSAQPPIQLVPRTLFTGVKRPRSEADHSPSSRTEIKNCGSITSFPPTSAWRVS